MSVRSLNKVMIIGNLTRDPQMRFTPSGTAVCTFGVATNRSWVPSDGGERQEETEFHNIVAWSKLAEICGQLLKKGDKVYVDGRIRSRKWTTQEGQERTTTEIVIDNMMLLSNRGGSYGNQNSGPVNEDSGSQGTTPADDVVVDDVIDIAAVSDDIPF